MKQTVSRDEVVSHLYTLIDSPVSEPLYSITLQDLLTAIALRMGQNALSLTATDLQLAHRIKGHPLYCLPPFSRLTLL